MVAESWVHGQGFSPRCETWRILGNRVSGARKVKMFGVVNPASFILIEVAFSDSFVWALCEVIIAKGYNQWHSNCCHGHLCPTQQGPYLDDLKCMV